MTSVPPPAGPDAPSILVITPGSPASPLTWSGIAARLISSLTARSARVEGMNGRFPLVEYAEKLLAFSTRSRIWHQSYSALESPLYSVGRRTETEYAIRRIHRRGFAPDAIIQVGARHDLAAIQGLSRPLRCSYHDSNFALFLRRPDLAIHLSPKHVARVMAFERRVYDGVDLIMCFSDWVRRSFIEDFDQDPAKVVVVGAGANVEPPPELPDRSFEPPRILFLGRQFERKGGPQLVAAFRLLRRRCPDAELWIAGPDSPPAPESGVRFLGRVVRGTEQGEAEIDRLYREATLFAMPSLYEPFGIVFLEAMSWGLPCIGANRCAMPEIIEDGATGRVVSPEDVESLSEAMLAIVADPDTARSMGLSGRRRFEEYFTWSGVAERMLDEIERRRSSAA